MPWAEERFSIVGIKVCKKSRFQLIKNIISKFWSSVKTNFQKPNCTNQTLKGKSWSTTIFLHFKTLHIFLSGFLQFLFIFLMQMSSSITFIYFFFRSRIINTKCYDKIWKKSRARNIFYNRFRLSEKLLWNVMSWY